MAFAYPLSPARTIYKQVHISLKFEINSLNYIAVEFGFSLQQNFFN